MSFQGGSLWKTNADSNNLINMILKQVKNAASISPPFYINIRLFKKSQPY